MLLVNLALFITVVGLVLNRQNKKTRKNWGIALVVVILILYWQVRSQLFIYSYRTLLYFSPLLILFFLPYYGYQKNWLKSKKNNISLFLLMLGSFIAFLIYSDAIVPLLPFSGG